MAMVTTSIGALTYTAAERIPVPHCFTTRLGGVSTGHLASMNIGTSRGDSRENVLENYRILGAAVGFAPEDLVLTHQTHTDTILRVGREQRGAGLFTPKLPECDGLITDCPGVGLVVFTADCTPVLLYDPVTGAVGAAHAGWRGTAAGTAAKTVEAMVDAYGCRRENIRGAIGPNIGPCCFETDRDVPDAMCAALGDAAQAHIHRVDDKYYVNLKALNALWLRRAGVVDLEISAHCTACQPDRYWSHRRMGASRGSQGAIIVCKGARI